MLTIKIILQNRIRDFYAILSTSFKIRAIFFLIFRSIIRPLSINEKIINNLIPNGLSNIFGYTFFTRKKTLDFLFISKYYERETTNLLVNSSFNRIIIFGAHIGRYAIILSNKAKEIVAYEPDIENYESLRINIHINRIDNIIPINKAIGVENKKVTMIPDYNTYNNTGKRMVSADLLNKQNIVDQITPDLAIINSKSDSILLIIDIEGMEFDILTRFSSTYINISLLIESFELKKLRNILIHHLYVGTYDDVNHFFIPKIN